MEPNSFPFKPRSSGGAGARGPAGPAGVAGPTGPAGPGVATGGTAGQVLTKVSGTNYDTTWATPAAGGASAPTVHVPTFLNGWSAYGLGYRNPVVYKFSNGLVVLEGLMQGGAIGDIAAFTLPVGWRPSGRIFFAVRTSTGLGSDRLDVAANGDVIPIAGGNGYFGLAGSWYAEL